MKRSRMILLVLVTLFVVIQFVRIPKTNPPVMGEIQVPPAVHAVMKRACYDCHSNETVWPWYSNVAPVSWLLYDDVSGGRRAMNFSEWAQMPAEKQNHRRKDVWKEVKSGDMPLWFYRPLHAQAKLTDADKTILQAWSEAGPAGPKRGSE
jgi:cytochrome c551/c552